MASALIATLGSEAQVVALAAQLLLAGDAGLRAVVVVHTDPAFEPIASALAALRASFATHPDWPALSLAPVPAPDVLEEPDLEAFATVLYATLKDWIRARHRIHLLLAGGRKPMAILGTTVAQMLFAPDDRVWYLHSDDALRLAGRMTLQPGDRAHLIPIPLPRLSAAPPLFTRMFEAGTPGAARQALESEHRQRLYRFVERELTPAEQELAGLVVREVLTVEEMARRLHKRPKTVTNQLNSIYDKLETQFGLSPDVGAKREFLRQMLAEYYAPGSPATGRL